MKRPVLSDRTKVLSVDRITTWDKKRSEDIRKEFILK
jgi:hypothetical protein